MPIPLSALEIDYHLRILLLGGPKLWKTTIACTTLPSPTRVLLCESDSALSEALRQGADVDFERCMSQEKPYEQMTEFLVAAKRDAKEGKIKSVLWDPLSDFADRLLAQSMRLNLTQNGEEDGRRSYPHYTKRLMHCIDLAFTIPAHVVVVSHFLELGSGDLGGLKKTGEGIVPLIPGSARARVAAKFNDVLWCDLPSDGSNDRRSFYTSPRGAWGPGCRSLPGKFSELPADFTALIKTFRSEGLPAPKKPTAAASNGKPTPKPPMKLPQSQVRR